MWLKKMQYSYVNENGVTYEVSFSKRSEGGSRIEIHALNTFVYGADWPYVSIGSSLRARRFLSWYLDGTIEEKHKIGKINFYNNG